MDLLMAHNALCVNAADTRLQEAQARAIEAARAGEERAQKEREEQVQQQLAPKRAPVHKCVAAGDRGKSCR